MFGKVDTGKGWHSQVCPRAIGGITTCHNVRDGRSCYRRRTRYVDESHVIYSSPIRWDIVCLSPQSYTSVPESFHIFIMARHRPFCTLSRFKLLQEDQGLSVPLAKCSFGMIPLSRYLDDRSPRAFHSSTTNVVRASCLFHLRNRYAKCKLNVTWNGLELNHYPNPIYLGVTMDRTLSFNLSSTLLTPTQK